MFRDTGLWFSSLSVSLSGLGSRVMLDLWNKFGIILHIFLTDFLFLSLVIDHILCSYDGCKTLNLASVLESVWVSDVFLETCAFYLGFQQVVWGCSRHLSLSACVLLCLWCCGLFLRSVDYLASVFPQSIFAGFLFCPCFWGAGVWLCFISCLFSSWLVSTLAHPFLFLWSVLASSNFRNQVPSPAFGITVF